MKKLLFLSILTAVLILPACARSSVQWQDTTPMPPTIQTSKTPLELLTDAVTNTQNAGQRAVQYGTITTAGEETTKSLHTQTISADHPLDWATLYQQVPEFPTNESLFADFCTQNLQAIPSNTGTVRYELTDLTGPELEALMYGQVTESTDVPDAVCTAAIEVDKDNRLTRLEFKLEQNEQNAVTFVLIVSFPS